MTSTRWAVPALWLVVVMLAAAETAYTLGGLDRLWYEELAESIRNPFWLDERLVYDGISSNVGWYGLLLLVYKVAGFSAYTAKFVRLALHAVFLVCAASLLKRWLGATRALIPLIAVGLSPTLLYFDNLATSYGTDVELAAVVLLLIVRSREGQGVGRARRALQHGLVGALAMSACLIFPSFLVYLPVLVGAAVWLGSRAGESGRVAEGLGWTIAGFFLPFAVSLIVVRNARAFLFDAAHGGAGVFRGGGGALTSDPIDIVRAIGAVFRDLFVSGQSYYFALPHVEFSGLLGVAAAWGILVGAVVVGWNWKPARAPLVLAGVLCALAIVVPSLSRHLPGLRRSTGFVAGAYVILACMWASPVPSGLRAIAVWAGRIACLLLVAHHLVVYVPNLRYVQGTAAAIDDPWFSRFGSPQESIAVWSRDWALKGKPLTCPPAAVPCYFSEIYPAVAGYLRWNGFGDRPVLAVDPNSSGPIALDTQRSRRP